MKRLNPEQQIRLATQAATRGWSSATLMRLISITIKNGGGMAAGPKKRNKKEVKPVDGHFDALAMINGKTLPENVQAAAIKTCQACSLYPEASVAICKECPLPDFLRRVEITKNA
jgi:hypothetical protein